jgi:hypothetical protein
MRFARSGFATVLRERIDLTTRFVATIVARLKACAPD